jgi:hypothetical protein
MRQLTAALSLQTPLHRETKKKIGINPCQCLKRLDYQSF